MCGRSEVCGQGGVDVGSGSMSVLLYCRGVRTCALCVCACECAVCVFHEVTSCVCELPRGVWNRVRLCPGHVMSSDGNMSVLL